MRPLVAHVSFLAVIALAVVWPPAVVLIAPWGVCVTVAGARRYTP